MRKILFILIALGTAFGIWWYFSVYKTGQTIPQVVSQISFPLVGKINIGGSGSDGAIVLPGATNSDGSSTAVKVVQKLEQIVPVPVAGYTVMNQQKILTTAAVSTPSSVTTKPITKTIVTINKKTGKKTTKTVVVQQPASIANPAPVTPTPQPQTTSPATSDFSTNNYIRYVDRKSGYVYEIANGGVATQITNIYIPNIYEALFSDQGKKVFLRFLRDDQKTVATFGVPIPDPNLDGSRTQLAGFFLADNIKSLAVSPDQGYLAQLAPNTTGGTALTISDTSNKGRKEIMNNPFHDWLISWNSQNTVSVQTRAAGAVEGFFYSILLTDARLKKILGNINGLTASLSPSGSYILYSESTQGSFSTKLYKTSDGTITTLAITTLPEKCVWTSQDALICATMQNPPTGNYPDTWYAGITHFSDKIIRISPGLNMLSILYDGGVDFDATNLQYDEMHNQLYFINKNDSTLWRLNI
ncbi:MAG: hypothetical protein WCQ32_00120 [bacterium]